jgi:tetratricopeptide (TPR) repeat protein
MALGKYEAAIKSLSKAQSLSLPDKEITDLSRQAKDLAIVANAAVKMVPKDNIVLRVMRYANSRTWVVLSAKVKVTRYSEYSVGTDVNDVHLTVLRGSPNRIRRAWQSRALGQPGDKYDEAQIEMLDVTGDGRPEVLLINSVLGADSLPTYLAVFRKQGTSLRKIFGGWSREPQTIEDLDGDGSREITIYYRIGWSLGVAGMPFWSDIHSFKKGAYQLANGDFPGQYNDLRREIRDSLKDSPGDFELLLYLGRIYEIQKQPYKALVYYRRALKSGYGELAEARSNGWGHLAARATSEISSTRQRIRAISRKRRADHY